MTVKDLMKRLEKLPENAQVFVRTESDFGEKVCDVDLALEMGGEFRTDYSVFSNKTEEEMFKTRGNTVAVISFF